MLSRFNTENSEAGHGEHGEIQLTGSRRFLSQVLLCGLCALGVKYFFLYPPDKNAKCADAAMKNSR